MPVKVRSIRVLLLLLPLNELTLPNVTRGQDNNNSTWWLLWWYAVLPNITVTSAAVQRIPSVPGAGGLQGGVHPSADVLQCPESLLPPHLLLPWCCLHCHYGSLLLVQWLLRLPVYVLRTTVSRTVYCCSHRLSHDTPLLSCGSCSTERISSIRCVYHVVGLWYSSVSFFILQLLQQLSVPVRLGTVVLLSHVFEHLWYSLKQAPPSTALKNASLILVHDYMVVHVQFMKSELIVWIW